jgi:hypothetical protein
MAKFHEKIRKKKRKKKKKQRKTKKKKRKRKVKSKRKICFIYQMQWSSVKTPLSGKNFLMLSSFE